MNLYLISQGVNNDYDTYDAAVVCAENEDDARTIHPDGRDEAVTEKAESYSTWTTLAYVQVELLGSASAESQKRGVILASFNAG